MRFDIKSILLAALAAGVAAEPASGGSYCMKNCSPGQIDDAFGAPSYLPDTKDFCRKYMHLPATIWVTKTKTTYITNYHTYVETYTQTAYPVTVTETDIEYKTRTDEEVSTTTEVDTKTVAETKTIYLTTTNDVTVTEDVTATEEVVYTTETTKTKVDYTTETQYYTYTVTKYAPKPYQPYQSWRLKKRLGAPEDIQIVKRGDYEYSSSYKIPSYLPQDISPEQIGKACKKINPCVTKTSTVYATVTIPSYKTKTINTWVTVTPTKTATITKYETNVVTITIPETVFTTVYETQIETTDVTAATVTETVATDVETVATVTKTVETDTITDFTTITDTVTEKATKVVTKVAYCSKGPAPCDVKYPESCCSGHCVKVFKSPNCCELKGAPCDIYHPEGCCSGKCKAQSYSYGKPVYQCY